MGLLDYIRNSGSFVLKGLRKSSPREFYDRSAANYDKTFDDFTFNDKLVPGQTCYAQEILKGMQELVGFKRRFGKGLDMGCGTGISMMELSTICDDVYGIDFSRGMLSIARNRIDGCKLVKGSFLEMPFANETFDVAWMVGAMRHLPEKEEERFFSELYRVMKPRGFFGVHVGEVGMVKKLKGRLYNGFMERLGYDEDALICSLERIGAQLKKQGFYVEKVRYGRGLASLVSKSYVLIGMK